MRTVRNHSAVEIIARVLQIDSITFDIKPSYNIAPSQDVAVVKNDGKKNCLLLGLRALMVQGTEDRLQHDLLVAKVPELLARPRSSRRSMRLRPATGRETGRSEGSVRPFAPVLDCKADK